MNRFRIWLIPALIVILALGALLYFRGPFIEDKVVEDRQVEVEVKTKKPKGFAKPVEPSPKEKVTSDTKAMVDALQSGEVSDCSEITWSDELKKQCEDNLNYAAILKSGDESQCDKLNDEVLKMQCHDKVYMTTAVDEKDISLCEMINDANLKQMCLDQVQMILSRYAKTAEDCSVISSTALRQQCEDGFYMHSSAKSLDLDGCENISDSSLSSQCKKTITKNIEVIEQSKQAAQNIETPKTLQEILELCNELSGSKSITCKNAIYPQLAFDEKDLSYCDKISDKLEVSTCHKEQGDKLSSYYLRQSIASSDKTLCDQILDDEIKQLCLSS